MQIISSIPNNSVQHKYTAQLSKTLPLQTIQAATRNNSAKFKYSFNVKNSSISNNSAEHKRAV